MPRRAPEERLLNLPAAPAECYCRHPFKLQQSDCENLITRTQPNQPKSLDRCCQRRTGRMFHKKQKGCARPRPRSLLSLVGSLSCVSSTIMETLMSNLSTSSSTIFWPLKGASDGQFKKLCRVLWEWDFCDSCKIDQRCISTQCPWQKRSLKLQPFFQLYQKITASYMPEMHTTSNYALRTHEDLFEVIQTLKQNLTTPRAHLTAVHFARRGYNSLPHPADQNRAFDLAVRVMTMVDCSAENQSGSDILVWGDDKSFQDLVRSIGSTRNHPVLAGDEERSLDPKEQLSAIRLKKSAHIKFRGTDDIKNHLRLEGKTVEIFHHTTVLKEHLRLTRDEHAKKSTENSNR